MQCWGSRVRLLKHLRTVKSFSWSYLSLLTAGVRLSAFIRIVGLWTNSLEVVYTSDAVHVLNCSGSCEVTSKMISFLKLIFIGI